MLFDSSQLAALSAAVSEGTFEGAARALQVTPSAISQRIKALELTAGRVLLVRSKPVQVTDSGQAVLRLARQVALLTNDAAVELGGDAAAGSRTTLPIAVNADSLATWVLPALAPLAASLSFDLRREDQEHTSQLLRDGAVMAAVTSDAKPVPGCSATPLGSMRYRVMAAPDFRQRWFADGVTATTLARAPIVAFDRKDDLQHRYLRRRTRRGVTAPLHYVPSSADFLAAVRQGWGWGVLPDLQTRTDEDAGELVDLDLGAVLDVALHWQQWKLRSPSLDLVAEAIKNAARRKLSQPAARRSSHRNIRRD